MKCTHEGNTPGSYATQPAPRHIALCESLGDLGLRRPRGRFASAKGDVRTATGPVCICAWLLAYGHNLPYHTARGHSGQSSRTQGAVVRQIVMSKLSVSWDRRRYVHLRTIHHNGRGLPSASGGRAESKPGFRRPCGVGVGVEDCNIARSEYAAV